jgi:membrane protein involved in colicin uptake
MEQTAAHIKGLMRRASQVGADDVTNVRSPASNSAAEGSGSQPTGQSEEDTMKNLRKTFAGIFGDM